MSDLFAYTRPVPIPRTCDYCGRDLVVTGSRRESWGSSFVFAHADDLTTDCTPVRTYTVRPHSGWGVDTEVLAEQRRQWAEEDAALDSMDGAP